MLLKYREKSYPALKEVAKSSDAEVSKRAEELIEKLEAIVPKARLELPEHDVIHTDLSKIAGKIVAPTLRARSFTFGDVPLKLSDVQAMSVNGFKDKDEVVNALPDPGTLTNYKQPQHLGKTYVFRVTGAVDGGAIWGTGTYTLDSSLAMAAVHAGVGEGRADGERTGDDLRPDGRVHRLDPERGDQFAVRHLPGAYRSHEVRRRQFRSVGSPRRPPIYPRRPPGVRRTRRTPGGRRGGTAPGRRTPGRR